MFDKLGQFVMPYTETGRAGSEFCRSSADIGQICAKSARLWAGFWPHLGDCGRVWTNSGQHLANSRRCRPSCWCVSKSDQRWPAFGQLWVNSGELGPPPKRARARDGPAQAMDRDWAREEQSLEQMGEDSLGQSVGLCSGVSGRGGGLPVLGLWRCPQDEP